MPLTHELHRMPAVAGQLLWAIERNLKPDGWELTNTRGGYNSYMLHKAGVTTRYYFRWRRGSTIEVLDAAQGGTLVATIATEKDVVRFVVTALKAK